MSFLGTPDGWPSPQLREVQLTPKAWAQCYRRVCRLLRDMYQKAGLVHADLSEYNLLYHEGRPFVIDVGQAVRTAHCRASQYLKRDIQHVNAFFLRQLGRKGPATGVVGDAALLAFVRMRRPRGEGEGEERETEEEEDAVHVVLERLVGGQAFAAAVAGTGFADPGGRAGQEEEGVKGDGEGGDA
jgi:serine/threonine-protein kinase RIO1